MNYKEIMNEYSSALDGSINHNVKVPYVPEDELLIIKRAAIRRKNMKVRAYAAAVASAAVIAVCISSASFNHETTFKGYNDIIEDTYKNKEEIGEEIIVANTQEPVINETAVSSETGNKKTTNQRRTYTVKATALPELKKERVEETSKQQTDAAMSESAAGNETEAIKNEQIILNDTLNNDSSTVSHASEKQDTESHISQETVRESADDTASSSVVGTIAGSGATAARPSIGSIGGSGSSSGGGSGGGTAASTGSAMSASVAPKSAAAESTPEPTPTPTPDPTLIPLENGL